MAYSEQGFQCQEADGFVPSPSRRPGKPTEWWHYLGTGDWAVHRLRWWNATTGEVGVGPLLRHEHKLR